MAKPKEKGITRMTDIDTKEVSYVPAGANRQTKFFIVKSDGENEVKINFEDSIPNAQGQAARSEALGIQSFEKSDLSISSGDPTVESMYGDPVNLKYPLAYANNELNTTRINKALEEFKGDNDSYSEQSSKAVVYERLVKAALEAGIKVSYDSENPVDALLSEDLTKSLNKDTKEQIAKEDEIKAETQKIDMGKWLKDAKGKTSILSLLQKSKEVLAPVKKSLNNPKEVVQSDAGVGGRVVKGTADPKESNRIAELEKGKEDLKKIAKQNEVLQKTLNEERAVVARLKASIGTATSTRPGEQVGKTSGDDDTTTWPRDMANEED